MKRIPATMIASPITNRGRLRSTRMSSAIPILRRRSSGATSGHDIPDHHGAGRHDEKRPGVMVVENGELAECEPETNHEQPHPGTTAPVAVGADDLPDAQNDDDQRPECAHAPHVDDAGLAERQQQSPRHEGGPDEDAAP